MPLDLSGIAANGTIERGQFEISKVDGPSPGDHRVEILSFTKTGRMIDDTDAPGNKVNETRQIIPAKYNITSTLIVKLDADNAENLEFNLDTK